MKHSTIKSLFKIIPKKIENQNLFTESTKDIDQNLYKGMITFVKN